MIDICIDNLDDGWILGKMANEILSNCPKDLNIFRGKARNKKNIINYYIAYHRFTQKTLGIDIPFLTHPSNQNFFNAAKMADFCVVMCTKYKNELIQKGICENKIIVIYPGVDKEFQPILRILQPGKIEYECRRNRKGYELWKKISQLPFVECICTEGKYSQIDLVKLYQSVDVILSTSLVEGGPMSVIEGLKSGKTVIAPRGVGFVDDFSGIITYTPGDFLELKNILETLYKKKVDISNNVKNLTWDNWSNCHYQFFRDIDTNRLNVQNGENK